MGKLKMRKSIKLLLTVSIVIGMMGAGALFFYNSSNKPVADPNLAPDERIYINEPTDTTAQGPYVLPQQGDEIDNQKACDEAISTIAELTPNRRYVTSDEKTAETVTYAATTVSILCRPEKAAWVEKTYLTRYFN